MFKFYLIQSFTQSAFSKIVAAPGKSSINCKKTSNRTNMNRGLEHKSLDTMIIFHAMQLIIQNRVKKVHSLHILGL